MFYVGLSPKKGDSPTEKAWKRRCTERLLALRRELKAHIHGKGGSKRDEKRFMRLATWNIREFPSGKFGERLDESYYYIAEIISHFDVIAIQEVREDRENLDRVMKILGRNRWDYIATDVTESPAGNRERMVFVFNTDKVRFRDVAGEITLSGKERITYPHEERLSVGKGFQYLLPKDAAFPLTKVETKKYKGKERLTEDLILDFPEGTQLSIPTNTSLVIPAKTEVTLDDLGNLILSGDALKSALKKATIKLPSGSIIGDALQFARTPFVVEFQSGWLKFILCTVHIYFGKGDAGMERRKAEIRAVTEFLGDRATSETDSDAENFFFVLGDFNIKNKKHGTWKALHNAGFEVPEALKAIPEGSNVDRSKAYDQIAYWTDPDNIRAGKSSVSKVEVVNAGIFDFFKTVFRFDEDDSGGKDEGTYTEIMLHMQEMARQAKEAEEGKPVEKKAPWKYKDWRTFQMSDHLPMWIELRTDFADEYLEMVGKS